jgi:hypothetical protein
MKDQTSRIDVDSLPLLLDIPRAAQLLGISRSAGYRAALSGELASRRLGGRIYIVTASLKQFELAETA